MSSSVIVAGVNVKEIATYLNCSICRNIIRTPKVLPCLHSFCQHCLENLTRKDGMLNCPQCQTEIQLSNDEVESLPSNCFLENMLDIALLNSSDTQPVPCTNCDLNAMAKSRCIDCGEFLCGDCYNVHKRIRQTKEHRILTIKELLSTTTGEVLHRLAYCGQHSTEQLKYFCDTCNEAVCRDCLIIEHRQHKYDYIQESKKVKKQRSNVETLLQETEEKISTIEKATVEIENVRDALYGRLGTVKGEIRTMTSQLIKILKEREQQLLFKADQMFNQKLSILDQQLQELNLAHVRVKTACDFTGQFLNFANEVEILTLKELIKNRLSSLNKMDVETKPRERGDMRYEVEAIDSERAVVQALGKVKTSGELFTEPMTRETSGINESDNSVLFTTSLHDTSNSITVDLKDSNEDTIVPALNGQTGVIFKPAKSGIYSLTVHCCNEFISSLPINYHTMPTQKVTPQPAIRERSAKQTFGGSGGRFGKLSDPQDVAVDNTDHVVVSDSRNHRIQVFDLDGTFLRRFGCSGANDGQLQSPNGVAVNQDGNVVVSDMINNRMQIFTITGQHVKTFGQDNLHHPSGVTVDKNGNVIIVDRGNARIVVYDKDCKFITSFGNLGNGTGNFNCPSHVAVNSKGHIIVSDFGNDRIQVFSSTGNFMFRFGESGRETGQFNWPTGVAVNQHDQIIVSDSYNHRIQIFNSDGSFDSQFGVEGVKAGEFKRPAGIVISKTGLIIIADWGNDRIQVF